MVLFSADGGVAGIYFNRLERLNALDLETAKAFWTADLAQLRAAADASAAAAELIEVKLEALLQVAPEQSAPPITRSAPPAYPESTETAHRHWHWRRGCRRAARLNIQTTLARTRVRSP